MDGPVIHTLHLSFDFERDLSEVSRKASLCRHDIVSHTRFDMIAVVEIKSPHSDTTNHNKLTSNTADRLIGRGVVER